MSGWRTVTLRGPKTHPSMGRSSNPCFMCLKGSEVSMWVWGGGGCGLGRAWGSRQQVEDVESLLR